MLNIGQIIPQQTSSNILIAPNGVKRKTQFSGVQSGEGIGDFFKKLLVKGQELGEKASEVYSSELGTALRNLIPDSDENARDGYAGEKHQILKLQNGKMGVANFSGPFTQVEKRIKRGDPPRTETDKIARAHDLRYLLANNREDIIKADAKFIKKLNEARTSGKDDLVNIMPAMGLVGGKVIAQATGKLDKNKYATYNNKVDDPKLMKAELDKMEQQGYGLPRDKIMSAMKNIKTNKNVRDNVKSIYSKLGLNLDAVDKKEIGDIIRNASTPSQAGKMLMPILVRKKLIHSGIEPEEIHIDGVMKHMPKGIENKLGKMLKHKQGGKGYMKGSGFWGDFKRGFTTVFKPASAVLSTVAGALGQPEIAIPLGIISKAL